MSLKTWYNDHKHDLKISAISSLAGGIVGGAAAFAGGLYLIFRDWQWKLW